MVGTEENVIAALNVDNGDIVWRRVLEKGDRGAIQYLQSLSDDTTTSNSLRVSGRQEPDRLMLTVTGTSFVLVRGWNIRTGNLAWEWTLQPSNTHEKAHWFATVTTLYHVQPTWDASTVDVTAYNIKSGQIESATQKVPIGSSQKQSCDFVQSFIVCTNNGELIATDLVTGTKKVVTKASGKHRVVEVSGNQ